jgi:outer membrane protein assembly factor BamC
MVKLGSSEEQSKAVVAAGGKAPVAQSTRMTTLNGQPAVEIDEGFDRAWRRVGVALDRTGFTVEDRDRSRACTLCATCRPTRTEAKKGFFGSMFSSKAEAKPAKYQIAVRSEGNKSQAVVLGDNGQPERCQRPAHRARHRRRSEVSSAPADHQGCFGSLFSWCWAGH